MIGFKGFDNNLRCRGVQFEPGTTYEHTGSVVICKSGFHFCENPIDVFGYYEPANSRYAEIEADGVAEAKDGDSKRVASKLTIKAEIGISGIISAGVKFILERVNFKDASATNTDDSSAATNTGYSSAATNTGDRSAATNTGASSAATNTGDSSAATNTGARSAATNTGASSAATNTGARSAATNTGASSAATNTGARSAATNTGDRSAATNTGEEGCAISLGIEGVASGAMGCWLTVAEWTKDEKKKWHRIDVQTRRVDGEQIKPNVFYHLRAGQFVEKVQEAAT